MFNAIDTSTSGLVAQRVRLDTVAMNIANADTVDSPEGGPYQRRRVLFSTGKNGQDRSGAGVHVAAVAKEPAFRLEYDPTHPYANKEGYVRLPDINPLIEMANGMEATRAYEANMTAIELSKAMLGSSLRLLA
jgi:flagellar basal-body rod protein FlgC